jgi:uncharacterized damage-inducible protein DinB
MNRQKSATVLEHLQRLFAYDDWANHEVLRSFQASANPPERSIQLLAHILSAERLWLERLQEIPQTYPVWPDFNLSQCKSEAAALSQLWENYLTGLSSDKLSEEVHYKNSKGESWANSIEDILTHVVMHSTYHRGQIAANMRATGNVPAYTDFIHGVRQGLLE